MEDNDNNNQPEDKESARFNMALDTLKRLGEILKEIKNLAYKTENTLAINQSIKINLVRQFFIQASPLLPDKEVENYKKEVLGLIPKINMKYTRTYLSASKPIGLIVVYDEKKEKRCEEILIELQMILQEEKYFMPSMEEEGAF